MPDLNGSIRNMIDAISGTPGFRMHSAWLYGSVVLDDFRPGWSDIDFVAFSEEPLTETQADGLLMLRQTLTEAEPGNPYYRAFEGIVCSLGEYRKRSFSRLVYWGTSGQRITDRHEPDAFSRYELAHFGKCLCGDGDRGIFEAPSEEELQAAVRRHYECIRKYAVQTDEKLYSCGWLLDIARCVRTLRYGDVIAKTKAGLWALEEHIFPEEEALRFALTVRQDPLSFRDREDVRAWLRSLGPVIQRYADVLEGELSRSVPRNSIPAPRPGK